MMGLHSSVKSELTADPGFRPSRSLERSRRGTTTMVGIVLGLVVGLDKYANLLR